MSNVYLIDGYNLMHQVPGVREKLRYDLESARAEVISKVAMFCQASGHKARLVFDGRGRQQESQETYAEGQGLEVTFAPGHLNADTVIERLVYNSEGRRKYVVVSGDRGIRDLCTHLGAFTMTPHSFLVHLDQAQGSLREGIKQGAHGNIKSLEDRLDGSTKDFLARLKDQLGK